MSERYNQMSNKVGFYYNSDPECVKQNRLPEGKNYIVFFNGENSLPHHLTLNEDFLSFKMLSKNLDVQMVKGTPKWSQRAYTCLYEH